MAHVIRFVGPMVGLALALAACDSPPSPRLQPIDLTQIDFVPVSPDEGIHPDRSVLQDPRNPFAQELPSDTAGPNGEAPVKWSLSTTPVGAFYSWATFLARQPSGENQYYAAVSLASIRQRLIDAGNGDPGRSELLADMGARAYQSVLDNFPGAVSYLADGVTSFALAPLAIRGILDLGKPVQNGWVLVMGENGVSAVRAR